MIAPTVAAAAAIVTLQALKDIERKEDSTVARSFVIALSVLTPLILGNTQGVITTIFCGIPQRFPKSLYIPRSIETNHSRMSNIKGDRRHD